MAPVRAVCVRASRRGERQFLSPHHSVIPPSYELDVNDSYSCARFSTNTRGAREFNLLFPSVIVQKYNFTKNQLILVQLFYKTSKISS